MSVEILTTDATYTASEPLQTWLDSVYPALYAGFDVVLPDEHVAEVQGSWSAPAVAEPHGQIWDRTLRTRGTSRAHARQWSSGSTTVHLDKWDPSLGSAQTIAHLASETTVGRLVLGVLASAGIAYGVGAIARRRR